MTSQVREELIASLLAWGTLAVLCTVLAGVVWLVRLRGRRGEAPTRYLLTVPWTGAEVLAAFILYLLLGGLGQAIGAALVRPTSGRPEQPAIPGNVKPAQILGDAIAFPLQLIGIPLLLFAFSTTRPENLGLTARDACRGVFFACCTWLFITPIILAINGLAGYLYETLSGSKPDEHPFIELAMARPPWPELAAMVGLAVVKAPLMEELLFRGVLQRWLAKSPWHCHLVYALTLAAPAYLGGPRDPKVWWIVCFVLAILPVYLGLLYLGRLSPDRNHYQSILVSSILFAAVHGSVWPTPVPLLPLGLCLGYLAFRTGSLVAPVTLHALFNAVACLTVLYLPAIEHGETTAAYVSSPSCTAIDWPACSNPRLTYPKAITDFNDGAQVADVTRPISLGPEKSLHPALGTFKPLTVKRTRYRLTCP
jgi:membrane protease YdiL (CAAX protease family)